MDKMQLVNSLLLGTCFGLLTSRFAKTRGRAPLGWFFVGFFLLFFGPLLLFMLPKVGAKKTRSTHKPLPVPKQSEAWLKMWYYLDPAHEKQGPMEFPDLIKTWKDKGIGEASYIWGEGMGDWKRLSELPDLIEEIKKA